MSKPREDRRYHLQAALQKGWIEMRIYGTKVYGNIVRGMALLATAIVLNGSVQSQPAPAPVEKGPAVSQKLPPFKARDQFGREQNLRSLAGPNGLVLLFVRSADW